jgi:hypothetical protein
MSKRGTIPHIHVTRRRRETRVFISRNKVVFASGSMNPKGQGQARYIKRATPNKDGGAYRDRTDDPLLAKQVLSQLS